MRSAADLGEPFCQGELRDFVVAGPEIHVLNEGFAVGIFFEGLV
jgi:hypothetical protein